MTSLNHHIATTFGPVLPHLQPIVDAVERSPVTLVKSCVGAGTTRLAASLIHAWCESATDRLAITVGRSLRTESLTIWREFGRLCAVAAARGGETEAYVSEHGGFRVAARWPTLRSLAFARGGLGEAGDRLIEDIKRGARPANGVLVVVDEATTAQDHVLRDLPKLLTHPDDRLLVLCHPTERRHSVAAMFDCDANARVTISAFDTPNLKSAGVTVADIVSDEYARKVPPIEGAPHPYLVTAHHVREWWVHCALEGARPNDPTWRGCVLAEFPSA